MPSFIIPAYNEGSAIKATVETIYDVLKLLAITDYQLIIINDGSADNSGDIVNELAAKDPQIDAVHHGQNRGLGASIRNGIDRATKSQFLVVPGDNDVSANSLYLLLASRDAAEVILTAPMNKEIRPHFRQILSQIYQTVHSLFFGTSISYINGPGIWPTELAKTVDLKSNRFSIISEMNVKLLTKGLTFAEVPIYTQAGDPTRATVTFANLVEVLKIFMSLIVEINLHPKRQKKIKPRRIQIEFVPKQG